MTDTYTSEFPQQAGLVYFNHAAVAPWPARTAMAVEQFAQENVRRGAVDYPQWLKTETSLRDQLRWLIHAGSSADIALVKNTSEGLSMVAAGLGWRSGDSVVIPAQEFPSNRLPWHAQAHHGVVIHEIDLQQEDPEAALISACDERTRVLAVSSVHYATGVRLDLARLGAFCQREGILFCVDAIQSLGALQIDVESICADFLIADAHKWMLGPEGIAVFYSRPAARAQLMLHEYGWHMVEEMGDYDRADWTITSSARRFECGSNNLLGIHALSASLSWQQEVGRELIESRILANTARLIDGLTSIPGITVRTPQDRSRHAGIVSFRHAGRDAGAMHQALVAQGVICACRGGAVRYSPHAYQGPELIDKSLEILISII